MNSQSLGLLPITTRAGYEGKHIYDILIDRLERFERVLSTYGFARPVSRIQMHLSILRDLRNGGKIHSDEILWSLAEATELSDLSCSLPQSAPGVLERKLRLVLAGPLHPQHETAQSNLARNTMFELGLAGCLTHKGVITWIGDNPDVHCRVADRDVFVQCKRPFSRAKIGDNIKRACKQLSVDLDRTADGRSRGVVAISLTHALNSLNAFLEVQRREELTQAIFQQIRPLAEHYVPAFINGPRIIGLVFHFVAPALIAQENHYRTAQLLTLHPSQNCTASDRAILRAAFLRQQRQNPSSQ